MSEQAAWNASAEQVLKEYPPPGRNCPLSAARKAYLGLGRVLWAWQAEFDCDIDGRPVMPDPIYRLHCRAEEYGDVVRRLTATPDED